MAKAHQFHLAAETIAATIDDQDIADAYVTLCVHAGIAAADVICCVRLCEYAQGDDHQEAVALLSKTAPTQAKSLKVLLDLKTRSGYSATPTSKTDQKRAGRAAAALVAPSHELADDPYRRAVVRSSTPTRSPSSMAMGSWPLGRRSTCRWPT